VDRKRSLATGQAASEMSRGYQGEIHAPRTTRSQLGAEPSPATGKFRYDPAAPVTRKGSPDLLRPRIHFSSAASLVGSAHLWGGHDAVRPQLELPDVLDPA
jgi:hypothetical protein